MIDQELKEWRELSARRKAFWPASGKLHTAPQYTVTMRLPQELVDWALQNIVGRNSYTCDLEETAQTALYALCGKLGFEPAHTETKEAIQAVETAMNRK